MQPATTLHGATVLWLRVGNSARRESFRAWGFEFDATTLTLPANTETTMEAV